MNRAAAASGPTAIVNASWAKIPVLKIKNPNINLRTNSIAPGVMASSAIATDTGNPPGIRPARGSRRWP